MLNEREASLFLSHPQILWRLVPVWSKLSHSNIVTFRGVTTELSPFALVYDWGEQDTIMKYTKLHPEARLNLVPYPAFLSMTSFD